MHASCVACLLGHLVSLFYYFESPVLPSAADSALSLFGPPRLFPSTYVCTCVFAEKADGALLGAAGKGMQGAAGKVLHGQILGVISTQMWGEFDGAGAGKGFSSVRLCQVCCFRQLERVYVQVLPCCRSCHVCTPRLKAGTPWAQNGDISHSLTRLVLYLHRFCGQQQSVYGDCMRILQHSASIFADEPCTLHTGQLDHFPLNVDQT